MKRNQKKRLAEILGRLHVKTAIFEDDTEEARQARAARVLDGDGDFPYFCMTYLPHYFTTALSPFHQELAGFTELKGRIVAVAAPRGHGKSTLMRAKVLFDIVRKARHFIVYVSASKEMAAAMTNGLRTELMENKRLKADFGDLAWVDGPNWAEGHFLTRNRVLVLARGRGQGVRGVSNGPHRPDLMILDDLEDDVQAFNPKRVTKVIKYVREVLIPAMSTDGQGSILWVGTILARRSALDLILRNQHGDFDSWVTEFYQAIQKDGTALCPELKSLEALKQMKIDMGSLAFNQELMNLPIDPNGLFREPWLKTYKPADMAAILSQGLTVAGIDPSIKSDETGDFKCIIVVTRHPTTADLYFRDIWLRHATIDAMVNASYDMHMRWKCQHMGLEAVGFQRLLFRDFDRAAKEKGFHLPLSPVQQSVSKGMRIGSMSPLHERGHIFYPEGWPNDWAIYKEQILSFPTSTVNDDGPDGAEIAIRMTEKVSSKSKIIVIRSRRSTGKRGAW